MFWIFASLAGMAFTFTKLGAASVMVEVLSHALGAALAVIAVLVAALVWQRFRKGEKR